MTPGSCQVHNPTPSVLRSDLPVSLLLHSLSLYEQCFPFILLQRKLRPAPFCLDIMGFFGMQAQISQNKKDSIVLKNHKSIAIRVVLLLRISIANIYIFFKTALCVFSNIFQMCQTSVIFFMRSVT